MTREEKRAIKEEQSKKSLERMNKWLEEQKIKESEE